MAGRLPRNEDELSDRSFSERLLDRTAHIANILAVDAALNTLLTAPLILAGSLIPETIGFGLIATSASRYERMRLTDHPSSAISCCSNMLYGIIALSSHVDPSNQEQIGRLIAGGIAAGSIGSYVTTQAHAMYENCGHTGKVILDMFLFPLNRASAGNRTPIYSFQTRPSPSYLFYNRMIYHAHGTADQQIT